MTRIEITPKPKQKPNLKESIEGLENPTHIEGPVRDRDYEGFASRSFEYSQEQIDAVYELPLPSDTPSVEQS